MIDNLFCRNHAGCVTGSQCEHALIVCVAFLVAGDACRSETLRVYNNLSKCFSVNNRVFVLQKSCWLCNGFPSTVHWSQKRRFRRFCGTVASRLHCLLLCSLLMFCGQSWHNFRADNLQRNFKWHLARFCTWACKKAAATSAQSGGRGWRESARDQWAPLAACTKPSRLLQIVARGSDQWTGQFRCLPRGCVERWCKLPHSAPRLRLFRVVWSIWSNDYTRLV